LGFGANVRLSSEGRSIRELLIYTQNVYGGSANTNGVLTNLHANVGKDVVPSGKPLNVLWAGR
jgi:hypothetical protein